MAQYNTTMNVMFVEKRDLRREFILMSTGKIFYSSLLKYMLENIDLVNPCIVLIKT
jgi:hypothetical protein